MAPTRSEILRNWRFMMLAIILVTPLMYYFSDLEYLEVQDAQVCLVWRMTHVLLAAIGLLLHFACPDWLFKHWRWSMRVVAYSFYCFFVWYDYRSIDPDTSSYYLGIMFIGAGTIAFRIYREAVVNIAIATAIYVAVNYDRQSTYEAVLDLSLFAWLFWLISSNYSRVTRELAAAHRARDELTETIHHDWKFSFRALGMFAKNLRPAVDRSRLKDVDMIEFTAEFLHAQASEVVDQMRPGDDKRKDEEASLRTQLTKAVNTIRTVYTCTIDRSGRTPPAVVAMDEYRLFRILLNLLANGITYSPDRRIRVEWTASDDVIVGRFSNRLEAESAIRSIHLENIFEKNFSLGSTGRGIGLHSSRKMAQACGGSLDARIEADTMLFTLVLPVRNRRKQT